MVSWHIYIIMFLKLMFNLKVLNKLNIILESTEVAVKEKLVQKDEFKARV